MAIIFNGEAQAALKEAELTTQVKQLAAQGKLIKIAAIFFTEDSGSRIYSGLKQAAAQRVGIAYNLHEYSLLQPTETVIAQLQQLNQDPTVTGIIIQKPTRRSWMTATHAPDSPQAFADWWHALTAQITPDKDVDGLTPVTQQEITAGSWQQQGRVLPATVKAVLEIIVEAEAVTPASLSPSQPRTVIIGRSDLLGQPLYHVLRQANYPVELLGKKELVERLQSPQQLQDAELIISATGQPNVITGEMIAANSVIIDVGEPRPDVDLASVAPKAAFVTPVPGGVGPMTVICLLENAVELRNRS